MEVSLGKEYRLCFPERSRESDFSEESVDHDGTEESSDSVLIMGRRDGTYCVVSEAMTMSK